MTKKEKLFCIDCAEHDVMRFYNSTVWEKKRAEILRADKFECQLCKDKYHRYSKATTVHHVNHFKARPDIALDAWYTEPGAHEKKRNLISLCHACHEEVHGFRKRDTQAEPLTEERWD